MTYVCKCDSPVFVDNICVKCNGYVDTTGIIL
jgi:hypothetical protein